MSDVFRTIVDMTDDRDAWKARAEKAEAEVAALRESAKDLEMEVRQFMWLGHGHFGVYGDDGEMQCSECGTKYGMWDYKREPIEKVRETHLAARFELMGRQQEEAKAAERKGMERALEIVRTHLVDNTLESPGFTWDAIEAAIRAAMEE